MQPQRRFAAFILTHGRPEKVYTYDTLRADGYTGPVYFIVDDEDRSVDRKANLTATVRAPQPKEDEMTDADNRPAVVGQVERPVRPAAEARWYCLSREGMATLCTDEEDAKEVAAESFVLYPQNGPYRAVQMVDSAHVTNLLAALQWYADGMHFDKASPDAWDTVSGEPQNWWCDEAGTATVEDGSIAAMTLRGELTAAQIQALD